MCEEYPEVRALAAAVTLRGTVVVLLADFTFYTRGVRGDLGEA